jgi:hypothetical protein
MELLSSLLEKDEVASVLLKGTSGDELQPLLYEAVE